jgi:hypothetical protein
VIVLRPLLGAATRLRSPIGLQLVDDFTKEPPLGEIVPRLDESVGLAFAETTIAAVITPSGVLAYPGLGHQAQVGLQPPKTYRVRVDAELYRPFYRAVSDGIVFVASPYNDAEPSVLPAPTFGQLILLPAFQYQYPSYVPVLRGEVIDNQMRPVADALVIDQLFGERTLTDERGAFSLPLRQLAPGVPDTINVSDRLARTGSLPITLPGALASGVLIPIA